MAELRLRTGMWIGMLGVLMSLPLGAWSAESFDARLDKVLRETPLIDGHNDLPWEIRARFKSDLDAIDLKSDTSKLPFPADGAPLMTDIPRLRAGRVGAQFWSVWVPVDLKGPEAVQATIEQIDLVKRMAAQYPSAFEIAYTAADVRRIHKAGKVA